MNAADITKTMSKLNILAKSTNRLMKNESGAQGRLAKLRKTISALFKYERLELNYNRADEARAYTEMVT